MLNYLALILMPANKSSLLNTNVSTIPFTKSGMRFEYHPVCTISKLVLSSDCVSTVHEYRPFQCPSRWQAAAIRQTSHVLS